MNIAKKFFAAVTTLILVMTLGVGLIMPPVVRAATINVPGNYTTIQAAIDAATAGDTINVAAGTYTEQLLIQKSLNIIGAGSATTFIVSPTAGHASVAQGSSTWDYIVAAYPTAGTINVRIEGFTINDNSRNKTSGTTALVAVFFRDVAGATSGLFNCAISGFPATPDYECFGIKIYGASSLSISGNTLISYTRDAIGANGGTGGNPTVTIINNICTGSAAPLQGISLVDGATGTVSGNTVTGHTRVSAWPGVGILVFNSSGVTINGNNNISNCTRGIELSMSSGNTVDQNTISNAGEFGIAVSQCSGTGSNNNTVKRNTIGTAAGAAAGLVITENSNSNMIGGNTAADGNIFSLPATTGDTGTKCIYLSGAMTTGNNTIKYNTMNGGTRAVHMDPSVTGPITISYNTIGNTTPPSMCGIYTESHGPLTVSNNNITLATSGTGTLYSVWVTGAGSGSPTISNNTFTGGTRAIQFDGPPGCTGTATITNNTISAPSFGGITAYNNGSFVITGNTLTNTVRPIEFFGPTNLTISNNTVNGGQYFGINLGNFTGTANVNSNTIHDLSDGANGIWAQTSGGGLNITGNTIYNIPGTSGGGRGIQLDSTATGAIIDGNELYNITGFCGICVDTGCTGVKINNNYLHNNEQGIVANEQTSQFNSNRILNNRWGVDLNKVGATFVLLYNSIAGNNTNATDSYGVGVWDGSANLQNNWWGANDGPSGLGVGHGDVVKRDHTETVNFDPWIKLNLSANPTSITANGTSTSTITADMTKNSAGAASGGFVPNGTSITIATTGGTVGSTSVVKTTTSGLATATLTSSTTPGPVTVSAAAPGDATFGKASTTVTFIPGSASTVTLTVVPSSIAANGTSTSAITAVVKDSLGNTVADGTAVTFTTSKGTIISPRTTASGTATTTLTSSSSTTSVVADITATATGVSGTKAVVFTGTGTTTTDVKTETVQGSGTVTNTTTGGALTVNATGTHTVTTVKYGSNPGGTPSFTASGNYYDVHIDNATGVTSITIQFSPATASTIIYYWTGTAWASCSNQTYAGGIVTVTVTATTFPNLADLSGLFFGSGTPTPTRRYDDSSAPTMVVRQPARVVAKYISVQPQVAQAGQPVTIATNMVNEGEDTGNFTAVLKVNGQIEGTKTGTLAGRTGTPIEFTVYKKQPGNYTIDINGQQASFSINGTDSSNNAPTTTSTLFIILAALVILVVAAILIVKLRRQSLY